MRRKLLGATGVEVSALCLGTMSFGGDADEAEAARIYAAARDAGVDFIDCANVYNGGEAERILGRLMAHERDSLVVTTKCHMVGGSSRRAIRAQVEASLRRLGTDRVDVLFLHHDADPARLEDRLRALEDIQRSGQAIYLGLSNYPAWRVATALGVQALRGWGRIDVLQPMYSLVKRQAEVELLPLAQAEGLGVIPYSPLGGGLLTGKYLRGETGRLAVNPAYRARYGEDWMHETARAFVALAGELGVHPATLAVAWAGAHPAVTAPIIGARSLEQLRPSLAAAEFDMTDELRARISALSRTPPPATDRLEEV
ncbi:aldo/keto reductase [Oceanicella actignis]|uniref:Predicted oxidoreductase n=1 Tax=Oceanicella actignis TaxID=1189325 RepID=A0A1M7RSE3_9RHOB|nr:aldo/keto reductase [Oceanicella actignis]SET06155.1 Predicted oxidoreductase [Oceanicella actignis]SHN49080.1 Predicted oxidoreductase [Oceanicella actignis]